MSVRSRSGDRAIARTSAIGLRREPQPPMPIVMPSRSSATTSSIVARLSATAVVFRPVLAPVDEGVARRVARTGEVELEGEPLLEPVGATDVDRVDAVERLLGRAHDDRVDTRDLCRDLAGCSAQLFAWNDLQHAAVRRQLLCGGSFRGVDHVPHPVLGHEPRQVGRGAESALLDLGEAEGRVVGGDDDVGVAGEPDAAAEAEPVHGGDHRDGAVIDRGEGGVAATVGADQRSEAFGLLHLLDVDAGVEALPFGGEDHNPYVRIGTGGGQGVGELEPAGDRQRVDRRHVHDDLGDMLGDGRADAHLDFPGSAPRPLFLMLRQIRCHHIRVSDYNGRAVLVTGGTKGLGRGIAAAFGKAGADVLVCARNAPEEDVADGFVAADLRDPEQAAAVVDAVVERFGRLDVVVNNAGGSPPAEAATVSPRFVEKIVALNLLAPFYVAQRANAVMQQQASGGGVIVNIGSLSGRRPSPGTAAYGAAKAGLANLTESLAMEWAPKVRVNLVTVGYLETEQAGLHYGDADGVAAVGASVPMGRLVQPDDVAAACLFLASPEAAFVTGADLAVHGGGEPPTFLSVSPPSSG